MDAILTDLTAAGLRDAGYRAPILQSTPDGQRLYPRLGLRTYCTVSRFLGGV